MAVTTRVLLASSGGRDQGGHLASPEARTGLCGEGVRSAEGTSEGDRIICRAARRGQVPQVLQRELPKWVAQAFHSHCRAHPVCQALSVAGRS